MKEDNQATIKIFKKGYSPKLSHVARTHKINLGTAYEAFADLGAELEYVETDKQVADVFTKVFREVPKWQHAVNLIGMAVRTGGGDTPVPVGSPVKGSSKKVGCVAQSSKRHKPEGEECD